MKVPEKTPSDSFRTTAWITPPATLIVPLLIGIGGCIAVVLGTPWLLPLAPVAIPIGCVVIGTGVWLVLMPTRLTLEGTWMRLDQPMRASRSWPVDQIQTIRTSYQPRVGWVLGINGHAGSGLHLELMPHDPSLEPLLTHLGQQLKESGSTRVVEDRRSLIYLGLSA